jgi:hypothetical protein
MSYDINQLRALRDNIDAYLSREAKEDMRIYSALEDSISGAVTKAMKPLVDEFGQHVDRLLNERKPS